LGAKFEAISNAFEADLKLIWGRLKADLRPNWVRMCWSIVGPCGGRVPEVETLERGGNDRAAQQWLARWSANSHPEPDNTQIERVRDFIRYKYEEKRWYSQSWTPSMERCRAPEQPHCFFLF
jgi:hypothetical protein